MKTKTVEPVRRVLTPLSRPLQSLLAISVTRFARIAVARIRQLHWCVPGAVGGGWLRGRLLKSIWVQDGGMPLLRVLMAWSGRASTVNRGPVPKTI